MEKNRRQRREVFADSGASKRGKERIRRVNPLDDEHGFGDQVKLENFHAVHPNTRIPKGSVKLSPVLDHYGMKNTGPVSSYRPVINTGEHHRDEGPSRYDSRNHLYHEHEGKMRYNHGYNELPRFEDLETDRAELIKKLDELKDKLTRSCELTEKSKENFRGNNQRMLSPTQSHPGIEYHSSHVQEGCCCTHGAKTINPVQCGNEAPCLSPCYHCTPYPNKSSYSENLRHLYPQERHFHEFLGYSGPGFRRSPHQSPSQYLHSPYNHESISYQPQASCSCVHCCNSHQNTCHLPEKIHPAYTNHTMNPAKRELHSRESLSSGDLDPYNPNKFAVSKKRVRVWSPIAAGAPFITCSNCFELLKLPKKLHLSAAKVQLKIKCGACSSIILFDLCSGGLVSSVSERIHKVVAETNQDSTGKEDADKILFQGGSNGSDTSTCFEDCDAVADPRFSPKEDKSKTCESEDEKNSDNTLSSEHGFASSGLPPVTEVEESTAHPNSFCSEVSEKYSGNNVDENKVQRSDVENAVTEEYHQSSLNETDTMATEMDVSLSELPNSSISQESEEMRKDDHSKDSSEIVEVARSRVFVNGHLIPVHEVKKAEKLAGPIQPGEYWYDPIAGFWGVMGHPCMGIIMPNIGAFDYPMPSQCAAGNTGVYVNGRELYEKDLDLLVGRGLPHTRNRSYIIDMPGKVIDQETGQELDSLGKLAPTIEKAKHGFGMKVPKYFARLRS